jgi:hypothetical protein
MGKKGYKIRRKVKGERRKAQGWEARKLGGLEVRKVGE